MTDNRNTILAVVLSGLVLIGWQYFFNIPQMEKQRQQTQIQSRDPLRCVTFTAAPARSRPGDHGVARRRTMPAICVATTTNVTPAKTSTTGTTRFDST